ncbi:MAG: YceI family protein [Actinobacteria bacterium]|nr:YceI family protein [Actinomycetota bacterium]
MSADLAATTGTWQIDPTHSTVGFVARHAMIAKVRGGFTEFTGTLTLDGADPAKSSAVLTIVTSSFTSSNDERDAHVKSADFLDVDQFPTLTFTSTAVTQKDDDEFIVTGDLTIHGVTHSVDVKFELLGVNQDPWGNTRIGFEGKAEISRKEFGLVWNVALETGGVLVGDTVKLELDIEAVKQA